MGLLRHLQAAWLYQSGHLFPWVPVFLGLGIGIYFMLPSEPGRMAIAGSCGGTLMLAALAARGGGVTGPVLAAAMLVAAGFSLASLRAHYVEAPVLGWRYYGPVEGRIVGIDRSTSDAVRLTLDRVVLDDVPPDRTPAHVRVSLHGEQGFVTPEPGLTVILTAHLVPPGGPVEPGGFDFQRHAWFQQLGAVGYTRTPVLAWAPPGQGQALFKARMALSRHVQDRLPGDTGGFAAVIMTGDRSNIAQDTLQALRVANLAHLLAISGLHMGLLAGFVFALCRVGLATVPYLGLRLQTKKLSAVLAIVVAAGYLALSGGNVATERAFVMVGVMLVAILFDRRALSLRAVAVAAVIVLCLRPEAMLGPGFQMSFAATTALVAVFGALRDTKANLGPKWARPVVTVIISSAVAGAATAPIAAAHFNQIAHFGLLANLLSVPLMGALVMPAAVLAACLLPVGLDWIALRVMGAGLDWILGVAHWVSGLDGARGAVLSPGPAVMPLFALGALFVVLWQGRAAWAGVIPVALAFVIWGRSERPDVLVSDTGQLVGIMTEQGRALSRSRGAGFVASNWLENDGDTADQEKAAQRWALVEPSVRIFPIRGKRAARNLSGCDPDDWIVMNVDLPRPLPCNVLHPGTLRDTGAVALFSGADGYRVVTARDMSGNRIWNSQ